MSHATTHPLSPHRAAAAPQDAEVERWPLAVALPFVGLLAAGAWAAVWQVGRALLSLLG